MPTTQTLVRWFFPVLLLGVALVLVRLGVGSRAEHPVAPSRNEPWRITPRYQEPRVATDEQLTAVLNRVQPPVNPVTTNNLVHALRLWGPRADFGNAKIPTGAEMLNYFLDDAEFRRWAGAKTPPLFYRGKDGLNVRSYDDQATHRETSSYHIDDLLATLAESGTPLTAPLKLRGEQATVGDLLRDSLTRFHLERWEYEWSAISYARYVFPQREWRNKYGAEIDLAGLVHELISHPLDAGPCNGTHRLEALVVLYRADEEAKALPPGVKRRIVNHLKRVSDLLVAAQTRDGYWTRKWPAGAAANADDKATLHDQLLVTGHQLEWLALAPEEVQPPRETIVRAGQWLVKTLTEIDEKTLLEAYGPYTHAARALCLWRSVEPYDAWRQGREQATPVAAQAPASF